MSSSNQRFPQRRKPTLFRRAALYLWRCFPTVFRKAVYDGLSFLGWKYYVQYFGATRLPFGLYKKEPAAVGEVEAMRYVYKNTTIPLPEVLDVYHNKESGKDVLILSRLPGARLYDQISTMTPSEVDSLAEDLRECFRQLRELPRPVPSEFAVSGFLGGKCRSCRTKDTTCGPFPDLTSFHEYIISNVGPEDRPRYRELCAKSHGKPHRVVLTHGDATARNILIDESTKRLTGLIDWENVGWFPEYWDYTNAYWSSYAMRPYEMEGFLDRVFPGYETELEVEKALWPRTGPFPW